MYVYIHSNKCCSPSAQKIGSLFLLSHYCILSYRCYAENMSHTHMNSFILQILQIIDLFEVWSVYHHNILQISIPIYDGSRWQQFLFLQCHSWPLGQIGSKAVNTIPKSQLVLPNIECCKGTGGSGRKKLMSNARWVCWKGVKLLVSTFVGYQVGSTPWMLTGHLLVMLTLRCKNKIKWGTYKMTYSQL